VPLLDWLNGEIEYVVTGNGPPVTVFAHGLAGSIPETRPFGSGVDGTRVFLHFRGHGASSAPVGTCTYAALADELRAVADHVGASSALGISLGAGALTRLVAQTPDRFERLVFVLPSAVDQPRADPAVSRMHDMARLVDAGDVESVAELLCREQPAEARSRPEVRIWASRQSRRLARTAVSGVLRELATRAPIEDRQQLASVGVPALVIAQQGDDAHPEAVARTLADALPNSALRVFDAAGVLWSHRSELRDLIAGFLNRVP
jgi:pimeloyl-ACP methyl ester carboxylesterase